jgi:hypothetical protein
VKPGAAMKKLPLIICFVFFFSSEIFAQTFGTQYDSGVIEEIYGDRVYVKSNLGSHIFEIISPCSWCETGITVGITFESFSRATMSPVPNTLETAPIQMFIIRDGREDNQ